MAACFSGEQIDVLEACTCACPCDGIVFWTYTSRFVCSSNLQEDEQEIFLDPTDFDHAALLEEKRRQDKKEDYRAQGEGKVEGKDENDEGGGEKKERKRKREGK